MVAHRFGALMRVVLLVYIVAAAMTAARIVDTPWFIVHGFGVVAGVCALVLSVHYAGLIGDAQRELYGPGPQEEEIEW